MSAPPHMRADDPAAADPARRRLLQKSSPRLPSLPSRRPKSVPVPVPVPSPDCPLVDILLDNASLLPPLHDDKDVYRWAVLYENQRGITLFSTPFYSPLSLLPSDPQPFTVPNPTASSPNLSLDNFPLPDGTWRWVSTAWMIDMRTDRGEVQHDGFEYNWSFRDNNWHASIGRLSAGAWVRRRRWVRLMMRPALYSRGHSCDGNLFSCRPSSPRLVHPTSSPSLTELPRLWDGSEQDWLHVHSLLRQLGRDGRKLELWRMWLRPCARTRASDVKGKGKQTDVALEKHVSDVIPQGNPPPLTHLVTILRNHGDAILRSFVFPDSRAQFVDLVRRAGLGEDLERCLGRAFSTADVDFWSYADELTGLYSCEPDIHV